MSHPQTAITQLEDALIDVEIVDAVLALNSLAGVTTISSCQGNPGQIEIENGAYGHIAFSKKGDWLSLTIFCFVDLRRLFEEFIDDEIRIDIFANSSPYAWLCFRNEMVPLVTERLRTLK